MALVEHGVCVVLLLAVRCRGNDACRVAQWPCSTSSLIAPIAAPRGWARSMTARQAPSPNRMSKGPIHLVPGRKDGSPITAVEAVCINSMSLIL